MVILIMEKMAKKNFKMNTASPNSQKDWSETYVS